MVEKSLARVGGKLEDGHTERIAWIADLIDMGPASKAERQLANAIRVRIEMEKCQRDGAQGR